MFKPNPRQQVITKVKHLFGVKSIFSIKVTGKRLSPMEAKQNGFTTGLEGTYATECCIDGTRIAVACDRDWRVAYKKLKFACERAWENNKKI